MVRQTLALILLSLAAAAEEYHISYTLVGRDLLAARESLKISRAMTPLRGTPTPLCRFEARESRFEEWAANNRMKLAECLLSHSASIRAYSRSDGSLQTKDLLILTTRTVPVQVDFNDGLVTIKKIQ
ncbi:hypothetical protein [Hydrogenimonas sp.]